MRVDVAVDVGVCHCLGLIIVVLCCHLFLVVGDAVIFFSSHFGVLPCNHQPHSLVFVTIALEACAENDDDDTYNR